jgi:hypothetical protein
MATNMLDVVEVVGETIDRAKTTFWVRQEGHELIKNINKIVIILTILCRPSYLSIG